MHPYISASGVLIPHPEKAETGGEDALFILERRGAFGVFDGVGGWAEEGVNPAEYSNKFADTSMDAVLMGSTDPRLVLQTHGPSTHPISILAWDTL